MERKNIQSIDYLLDMAPNEGAESLTTVGDAASPAAASGSPDVLLRAFAATQVLQAAQRLTGNRRRSGVLLSEIDAEIHLGAVALVPTVDLLVASGLLSIVEKRPFDDHRVTVSADGARLAKPGKEAELMRRLGVPS